MTPKVGVKLIYFYFLFLVMQTLKDPEGLIKLIMMLCSQVR